MHVGTIPTLFVMCRNIFFMLPYTCRNHASYTSVILVHHRIVAIFYETLATS